MVAMAAGTFRQDLFYRLNVFPIQIPALSERRDDIPILLEYFIERYAKKAGKRIRTISKRTLELFQAYDFGPIGLYVHALRQAIHRNREESPEGAQEALRSGFRELYL